MFSTDPSLVKSPMYINPKWAKQNDKWDEKGFRLWNMASINHIGEPDSKTGDVQMKNDGSIKKKSVKVVISHHRLLLKAKKMEVMN